MLRNILSATIAVTLHFHCTSSGSRALLMPREEPTAKISNRIYLTSESDEETAGSKFLTPVQILPDVLFLNIRPKTNVII